MAGRSSIQRPPGFKLITIAELFSRRIRTEVLEPTIRDLQKEHLDALAQGSVRLAHWVVFRGYVSFWSAVIALAPVSLLKKIIGLWKALP